jgi:chromosome segregation ATPase
MDNSLNEEQLQKRVSWLDNELRNDKTAIASLQSKLESLDTENSALRLRVAELESEITRINTLMALLEQFKLDIHDLEANTNRQFDDIRTSVQEKNIQSDRNEREIEGLKPQVTDLRKKVDIIGENSEAIEMRKEEDIRLARLIEELKVEINEIGRFDEEYKRSLRMIEDNRRQDVKRLTDMQGEIAAMRKRQDEIRGKQDLVGDNLRKVETRIKDLLDAESERRESQTAFTEKVNIAQVEQERVLKQWAERFEKIEQITDGIDEQLIGLQEINRSVKKSQSGLDDVTQRFERRINEITEVQRLNEDRFRQEWTTFKSDDQKRWSNYVLSQEEQHREMSRGLENLGERIASLDELFEELQDKLEQLGGEDLKRMQSLLKTIRESIDAYNYIFKG